MARARLEQPARSSGGCRRATTSSAPPTPRSRWSSTAATPARIAAPPTSASPRCATEFGDRLRYVFRHRPLTGSDIARRAAELVERADDADEFWDAHVALMTRSETLTEDDLRAVARRSRRRPRTRRGRRERPGARKARVDADEQSARASGVMITPTFFINGRRYDGAVGRELVRRRDARLARPSRALRRARLRQLGAVGRRPAAARDAARGGRSPTRRWGPASTRSGSSTFGLRVRRRRASRMSLLALGQRRPADDLLPGRRPRDQARVHRRPSRQPALRGAADRRRDRRHGRAGADLSRWSSRTGPGRTAGACRWRPTPPSRSR